MGAPVAVVSHGVSCHHGKVKVPHIASRERDMDVLAPRRVSVPAVVPPVIHRAVICIVQDIRHP